VAASLNVQTDGLSTATQLKAALGLVGGVASEALNGLEQNRSDQAQQDFLSTGEMDPVLAKKSDAYVRAFNAAKFDRDLTAYEIELEGTIAQHAAENKGVTLEDVNEMVDLGLEKFYKDEEGVSIFGDRPDLLRAGLQRSSALRQRILGRTTEIITHRVDSEYASIEAENMRNAYMASLDEMGKNGKLGIMEIINDAPDKTSSVKLRDALVPGAIRMAVDANDEAPLQELLDARHANGPLLDAAQQAHVAQALSLVKQNRRKIAQDALALERIGTRASIEIQADQGIFDVSKLNDWNKRLGISESFLSSQMSKAWSKRQDAAIASQYGDLVVQGRVDLIPPKDQQKAFDLKTTELARQGQYDEIIKVGVENKMMPSAVKEFIEHTAPGSVKYPTAYEQYVQWNNADAQLVASVLPKEVRADFEVYKAGTTLAGKTPEQMQELMNNRDPELAKRFRSGARSETAISTIQSGLTRWFEFGEETPQSAILDVQALGEVMYSTGVFYKPEDALERAAEIYSEGTVYVDNVAFRKDQGWPQNTDEFAEFAKQKLIPEGEDADDWAIVPTVRMADRNTVRVVKRGELFLPGDPNIRTFNVREMAASYAARDRALELEENQRLREEQRAEAVRSLVGSVDNLPVLFNTTSFGVVSPGARTRAIDKAGIEKYGKEDWEALVAEELDRRNNLSAESRERNMETFNTYYGTLPND